MGKLLKLFQFLTLFRRPLRALRDRLALIRAPLVEHELLNGLTFWCRPGSSDLMSVFDIFTSQRHSAYLSQFKVKEGDTVVDIGANIGVFSLQAALSGATVTAYEPMADTCKVMRINIAANKMADRVQLVQKGVAQEAGPREIFLGNRNHSMSCSLIEHENTSADAVTIQTIAFADVLAKHALINLLKIDCEGAEFEFLGPGCNLSNVDKVVLEYHEIAPGFRRSTLEAVLRHRGFTTQVKPWKPGHGIIYAWRADG